ncbi:sugar phosphate isomerase/epimerase [Thermosporothrix hazakensis]|jgi:sugar phosphate isomerase/epimerase|uniref:Sugar phosphate isomerase/epimerase n=1 Tax=Thermosporothrix hazakensis TaxID=644383 RepID=A0A326U558_THEHA|nr:sugar phosphate isomerase/epimerase family protein [Thermosporothrix hazakensis]PZW27421.1 sugar phosphate isomerase/epimerase [Thermosporothrix hazakensis]GCE45588.1 xylose isomerase [Thermosporothrix hazakensis]
MRLAIITDEIAQDLTHALQVCRELEVNTVELRSIDGHNIVFHDGNSLKRIKAALDQAGMQVCCIASPFLKCHFWLNGSRSEFDSEETQWAIFERSLELARLFQAPLVRTFSFWRLPNPASVQEKLASLLVEATRRAEEAGVTLALENEHECNLGTGAETAPLLQRIPSRAFGVIWDPGNEAKLGSQPYPHGYQCVRERVVHVHLKDVDHEQHFVKMGSDTIAYEDQLRALAADGYTGVLSLETHYQHPTGGPELATRESLAALRTLCQQAEIEL